MKDATMKIFEEIFHNTNTSNSYCSYDELATITGQSVHTLRSAVEDLKEKGFVVENENGIQITGPGQTEAGTYWVD